ncbi:hypothetical protein R6258_15585 [Halomonas sp. HP20-15]|uniref:hypothetical protein n=1 Tax=Halomonas sp. HP20-15 TaxID=3085901 RepID=UPI00298158D0|nr:hypothetical protein [Halomonas sp. HP20-15]MDW5378346.1 hypothetical protein [Halomonas sp. HP20-15]
MKCLASMSILLMLLAASVTGCATSRVAPSERLAVMDATPRQTLSSAIDELVARGFVIRLANAELGRVDAVLATRSGYVLTLEASEAASGTRLAIQGRQGGQPLDPARFDALLAAIQARLVSASTAP